MPWWAWIALGAGGWLVVAVAVAFGAARLIAAAERATRPETAADASNKVGQAVTPGCASPGGSGQTRGQYGPSPNDPTPTGDAFIDRFFTPGLVDPPMPDPRRKEPT